MEDNCICRSAYVCLLCITVYWFNEMYEENLDYTDICYKKVDFLQCEIRNCVSGLFLFFFIKVHWSSLHFGWYFHPCLIFIALFIGLLGNNWFIALRNFCVDIFHYITSNISKGVIWSQISLIQNST